MFQNLSFYKTFCRYIITRDVELCRLKIFYQNLPTLKYSKIYFNGICSKKVRPTNNHMEKLNGRKL